MVAFCRFILVYVLPESIRKGAEAKMGVWERTGVWIGTKVLLPLIKASEISLASSFLPAGRDL